MTFTEKNMTTAPEESFEELLSKRARAIFTQVKFEPDSLQKIVLIIRNRGFLKTIETHNLYDAYRIYKIVNPNIRFRCKKCPEILTEADMKTTNHICQKCHKNHSLG